MWDGREIEAWEVNRPVQSLNLTSGLLTSNFFLYDLAVEVETVASPTYDALSVSVRSDGFNHGHLALFLDFPDKGPNTDPPFVGNWRSARHHSTTPKVWGTRAEIRHDLDGLTYYTNINCATENAFSNFTRQSPSRHRYVVSAQDTTTLSLSARFSQNPGVMVEAFEDVKSQSQYFWNQYWNTGAFIDCRKTNGTRAHELQRRVILSQYILAVNCAGTSLPLEAGLVSNGLPGKSPVEMMWWHLAHWERWSKWERVGSVIPIAYQRLLNRSIDQARADGFEGAFWGGEIDRPVSSRTEPTVPIWQQAHPFYFAEQEYLAFPTSRTLKKWHQIVEESSKFMASFARWNKETKVYDLAPTPTHSEMGIEPAETKEPNAGASILALWIAGGHKMVRAATAAGPNEAATHRRQPCAVRRRTRWLRLPRRGRPGLGRGAVNPAIVGIFGMLPSDDRLNMTLFRNTVANVYRTWNSSAFAGWELPLLAMTAARMGDPDRAVDLLLGGGFGFDDAGLPVGNSRALVPRTCHRAAGC